MTPKHRDLLTTQLRREHEAIWTFETIAARSEKLRKLAERSAKQHRSFRDEIRHALIAIEIKPPTPAPGYESQFLTTNPAMRERAQTLLGQLTQLQLEMIGETTSDARGAAVANLATLAVSAVAWGAPVQAFPGLD